MDVVIGLFGHNRTTSSILPQLLYGVSLNGDVFTRIPHPVSGTGYPGFGVRCPVCRVRCSVSGVCVGDWMLVGKMAKEA